MTDLEKAKQWAQDYFNEHPLDKYDIEDVAKMLAAYASHSNSELLERVRDLALAALGWLSTSECHHKDDATCPSRQRLKAEIEKSLGPTGIITQIDVAKAPETRNV